MVSANPFDQASRYTVKLDPWGMLCWLLGVRVSFRRWLDTRSLTFPGQPDRTCDTVAHAEDDAGRPWALPIEFQIQPDAEMFGRLLVYLGHLWLEYRPDPERGSRYWVAGIVVNLTGRGQTSQSMQWAEADLATSLLVKERDLETIVASVTLDEIAAGQATRAVLPWIPLMTGGDDPAMIQRWKELAQAEPDPRRRADFAGLAVVFAEAAGRRELWHQALVGWNMIESVQVREWMAEGEARGEVRGQLRACRTNLLDLLQDRFGALPPAVVQQIEATEDLARLRAAVRQVLHLNQLDDLRL